jgi:hypothetical protein
MPCISITADRALSDDKPLASNFKEEVCISVTRICLCLMMAWISATDFFSNSASVMTEKAEFV